MRFSDNVELTAVNMAGDDILAGTDVSVNADKKFALSGLADWFLNRFTGLSYDGGTKSVKEAFEAVNTNTVLTTYSNARPKLMHTNVNGAVGLSGNSSYNSMQGVCYDSNREHWFAAVVKSDFSDTMLVELDASYSVISRTSIGNMSHANDLTYNSTTDKLYCVTDANRTVVEISPSTKAVTNTIQISGYDPITIAYDALTNQYFVSNNKIIHVYDSSWTETAVYNFDIRGGYYGTYDYIIPQGMFVYDGRLMAVYNTVGDSQKNNYVGTFVKTIDLQSEQTKDVIAFIPDDSSDEAEGGDVVDGVIHVLSGSRFFRAYAIYTEKNTYNNPDTDLIHAGTQLLSNSSLNDIYETGKYYCPSAAVSQTISGTPANFTNMGFTLFVITQSANFKEQILIDNDDNVYMRMHTGSAWKSWTYRPRTVVTTDGVWTILKFEPLKMFIAFCNTTVSPTGWTAQGNIYYSASLNIPMAFMSSVTAYSATGSSGATAWFANFGKSSSGLSFRLMHAVNTVSSAQVQIQVMGIYS